VANGIEALLFVLVPGMDSETSNPLSFAAMRNREEKRSSVPPPAPLRFREAGLPKFFAD
jgi:hypothetical protein